MSTSLDLKSLRMAKGLPQGAIGSRKHVIEIEKGRRLPGLRLLRRMSRALRLPPEDVWAACQESCRRAKATEATGAVA